MSALLSINVNDHTERKNNLTYLSWAWAWAEVLKIDPDAEWSAVEYESRGDATRLPCMFLPDGTAMVKTQVTIKGKTKTCMLPVMNHSNKAIKNPDAFAINTAIMRCMTKAVSMHGLGLYIYAGEDLPESEEPETKPEIKPAPTNGVKRTGVAQDVLSTSPPLPPSVMAELDKLAVTVTDDFNAYGPQAAFERIEAEKLEALEKIYLSTKLDSGARNKIKAYSIEFHSKKPRDAAWRAGA
jgi:hypothetical protein